jgi:hypothetical protein
MPPTRGWFFASLARLLSRRKLRTPFLRMRAGELEHQAEFGSDAKLDGPPRARSGPRAADATARELPISQTATSAVVTPASGCVEEQLPAGVNADERLAAEVLGRWARPGTPTGKIGDL